MTPAELDREIEARNERFKTEWKRDASLLAWMAARMTMPHTKRGTSFRRVFREMLREATQLIEPQGKTEDELTPFEKKMLEESRERVRLQKAGLNGGD